jgi:aerobic carbon-monoxide dehydrogenase large subunit
VFAQLVHEFLGVPFDQIRYVQGDTAQVQFGRGTYGARSAVVGGSALRRAADAIIDKAKLMAAAMLEADAGDIEFKDGNFTVAGTDKAIPLVEVAKASFAPIGPMTQFGIGLEGSGSHSPEPPSHPNGAHAVEVEIDPETGEVLVDRYVMVDDLGQVLNPMIVNGQQHGGVAQGIGQALYEHAVYDRSTAQLVTGSFMDYAMPRADMLPKFEIALEEVRCKTNPIGVKVSANPAPLVLHPWSSMRSLMRWVHLASTALICQRPRTVCGRRYKARREWPNANAICRGAWPKPCN